MGIVQTLRITRQGMKGWDYSIDMLYYHIPLIKKLYAKNGLELKMTGNACPEQYEVFKDGKQVAYYRLRHGEFTIDHPTACEEEIFAAEPNGDGIFDSDERLNYLAKAMRIVLDKIK